MRRIAFSAAILTICIFAAPAFAQQGQSGQPTQPSQPTQSAQPAQPGQGQAAQPAQPQGQQVTVANEPTDPAANEWAVSGFAGPGFGESFEGTEMGYGGAVAFLHNRRIGAEFLANFTPGFADEGSSVLDSNVNNYMANAIAAVPLGRNGRIQPFVSGGFGAMRLRADVQNIGGNTSEVDDTKLGANIGAGLMWFEGRWGVRTDLRYFTALNDDEFDRDDQPEVASTDGLTDTNFWRYDLGVAYRW